MNKWILAASILSGFILCFPLFRYMFKAAFDNAPEFDSGYKKELNRDATDDFISGVGSQDNTVNSFVFANVFMLLLPLIPMSLISTCVYFLLAWIFGVF